jgi:hypothetical protein
MNSVIQGESRPFSVFFLHNFKILALNVFIASVRQCYSEQKEVSSETRFSFTDVSDVINGSEEQREITRPTRD